MIRSAVLRVLVVGLFIGAPTVGTGAAAERPGALVGVGRSGMPSDLLAAVLEADPSQVVYKVAALPRAVLTLSGMSLDAVADADEPYNETDVVMGGAKAWPFERLVWGVRAGPYYLVDREVGGDASSAGITAYRLDSDGGRFAWSALTMSLGRPEGLSTYRTFEEFRSALRTGLVRGSTGDCIAWLSAPQDALRQMLLPATGETVTDRTRLPPGVRAMVDRRLLAQGGSRLVWAAPVDGGYIVQTTSAFNDRSRIAVIRTPVRQSSDLLWLGAPGRFEDYDAFQHKLRSHISVEVEQAILRRQCQTLPAGWTRPGSEAIIAPIAG